ncbi:hypothetical protein D5S19_01975 [Amycolatopsis panacis]|uniref:ANTAR domain-containing protein n=2 Tax=Amycolatopsis panacis TaxID=2340917 RepID=A0A419IBC7_9PSEU|nr:hypothetical protein D5S19_01975 [Amycolatopsis panacis]
MLLQAVEYRDLGVQRVDGWLESAREGLKTVTAQRIAEAVDVGLVRPLTGLAGGGAAPASPDRRG